MPIETVLAFARHGMTFAGGWLVTQGYATDADVQTGAGAAVTLIGLVWSLYRKWRRANAQ